MSNQNKLIDLSDAIVLATRAHEGQVDQLGRPYILHCLRVMESLGPDNESMIVGVLHDVLEDTDEVLTPEQLGYDVFQALQILTRDKRESYEDYIERVCKDSHPAARLARRVKLADLRDNINRNGDLPAGPRRDILRARYTAARDAINAKIQRSGR